MTLAFAGLYPVEAGSRVPMLAADSRLDLRPSLRWSSLIRLTLVLLVVGCGTDDSNSSDADGPDADVADVEGDAPASDVVDNDAAGDPDSADAVADVSVDVEDDTLRDIPGDIPGDTDVPCSDSDEDGICDDEDLCPDGDDAIDADADGVPDACDVCEEGDDALDGDGDGTPDACDICEGGNDALDSDEDGVPNGCDLCEDGDDEPDADEDGVPDACDVCADADDTVDTDEDGVPDACDVCEGGDDTAHSDEDGLPDACDNCPETDNPDQLDSEALIGLDVLAIGHAPREIPATELVLDDDDTVVLELPFTWNFMDTAVDDILLSSNGFLHIDLDSGSGCCSGQEAGDSESFFRGGSVPAAGLIAFLWEDLYPHEGGTISWGVQGEAPEREVVVAFVDVVSDGAPVTVQVVLGESGYIEMHCTDCSDGENTRTQAVISPTDWTEFATIDGRNANRFGLTNDAVRFIWSEDRSDGIGDACDPCPLDNPNDTDEDGVCESVDICPGGDDAIDTDEDFVPDACDLCEGADDALDEDGDGVPDDCDMCEGSNDSNDGDGDGVPNGCDLCDDGDDALDDDEDGVPDACDVCEGGDDTADADEDEVPDSCDLCPAAADPDQRDSEDIGASAWSVPFLWRGFEEAGTVGGDDNVSNVELGFDFTIFGETHTTVNVAVNGHLHFGSIDSAFSAPLLPSTNGDGTLISGFRSDLNAGRGGRLSYGATGVEPNRVFVAEWDQVAHHADSEYPRVSMQIVLFEAGGAEVHCADCPSYDGPRSSRAHTQGVVNADETAAAWLPGRNRDHFSLIEDGVRFGDTSGSINDGIGDACDAYPGLDDTALEDTDADGVLDISDACEGDDDSADSDSDGTPDACDVCDGHSDSYDDDGDGTPDGCDVREPNPGDIILTEIFALSDPDEGDSDWVEIQNVSGHQLDMSNVTYAGNAMAATDTDEILEPGEFAVIAGEDAAEAFVDFRVSGFGADDMVEDRTGTITLSRDGAAGALISLSYGEEEGFFDPDGYVSFGYGGDWRFDDNQDETFWCDATSIYEGIYFGTPGEANDACWTCGDGIQEGAEHCDDGNTDAGDGCGYRCFWEGDDGCRDELVNNPVLPFTTNFETREAIFDAGCELGDDPVYHYVFTWRARDSEPVRVRVLDDLGETADVAVSMRTEQCSDQPPLFACGNVGGARGDVNVDVVDGDDYQVVVESAVLGAELTLSITSRLAVTD